MATYALPPLAAARNPFADKLHPTEQRSYDGDLMNYLAERREIHVHRLHSLVEACGNGNAADLDLTADVARESLVDAVEDIDAYACLGANPYTLPYPSRHVIHTAMTAAAIGVKLGLDERQLHELSIGCLIHDLGMLSIDRMTVGAKKVLESIEFAEIAKHPLHTFDLIEKHIDVVPLASRMVAYQMHERCDGSGYPRGKRKEQIHPLARIAAVADSFTALVSARPHRPRHAAVLRRRKTAQRHGPRVVRLPSRARLAACRRIFPVGSFVSLSNGCVGRVIRANPTDFTKPLIEMWPVGRTHTSPAVVDLVQVTQLTIVRPLTSLHG